MIATKKIRSFPMNDKLRYKDYVGTVHYNDDDGVFFGKIEGINHLITFEGESVNELKTSFVEAIEDYLLLCSQTGENPQKSYKGSFNIRISPEIHKLAVEKSTRLGIPLNRLIYKAIEKAVLQ